MRDASSQPTRRDAQRRETYERVFESAVAELKRSGLAGADVGTIVSAAGVARGTFYFHFPTKEHVLGELERRIQQGLCAELRRYLAQPRELADVLHEVIRLVVGIEAQVGSVLFRNILALHFLPTDPSAGEVDAANVPVVRIVVDEIERARAAGAVYPGADAVYSACFFLVGLYALLVTSHATPGPRDEMLDEFVRSAVRSLEAR